MSSAENYEAGLDVLAGHGGGGHGGGGHGGHGGHGHGAGFPAGAVLGPWWDWSPLQVQAYEDCDDFGPDGECLTDDPQVFVLGEDDTAEFVKQEAARQHQMSTLKVVPVNVAREMLRGGQQAIDQAREIGNAGNLPGGTNRDEVYYKLQWHANELGKAPDPYANYTPGNDLKTWVTAAYRELDVAETGIKAPGAGALRSIKMWNDMWTKVMAAFNAIPKALRDAMSSGVEWATGIPAWVWGVGVLGVMGLIGYGTYRILRGPAGQAIVTHYLGRRK